MLKSRQADIETALPRKQIPGVRNLIAHRELQYLFDYYTAKLQDEDESFLRYLEHTQRHTHVGRLTVKTQAYRHSTILDSENNRKQRVYKNGRKKSAQSIPGWSDVGAVPANPLVVILAKPFEAEAQLARRSFLDNLSPPPAAHVALALREYRVHLQEEQMAVQT